MRDKRDLINKCISSQYPHNQDTSTKHYYNSLISLTNLPEVLCSFTTTFINQHPPPVCIVSGNVFQAGVAGEITPSFTLNHTKSFTIKSYIDNIATIFTNLYEGLNLNSAEHPVIFAHYPLEPRYYVEKLKEIAFEELNIPHFFSISSSFAGLIDSRCETGLSVNIGIPKGFSIPIYEGFDLTHAFNEEVYSEIILRRLTGIMGQNSGKKIPTEKDIFDYITSLNTDKSSHLQRYFSSEFLLETLSEVTSIIKSIMLSDVDIRKVLFDNIVLFGEIANIPGIKTALQQTIKHHLKEYNKKKNNDYYVRVLLKDRPHEAIFRGCSLVGSVDKDTLDPYFISKQEYLENGNWKWKPRGIF